MVVATPPLPPPSSGTALAWQPPLLLRYSLSIPFLPCLPCLTGRYTGNVGFNPLNLSSTPEALAYNRDAEVKHTWLAMLAAASWLLSKLLNDRTTTWINNAVVRWDLLPGLLSKGSNRVPSLLNSGMGNVSPYF
jgi:hypothetical protein